MARQRIQWPFKGRTDNNARGDQPELTTSEAENVRNFSNDEQRMQGGQRPGLKKWTSAQIAGSDPVRHIAAFNYDSPAFDYSQSEADITDDWAVISESQSFPRALAVDADGYSYTLLDNGTIEQRNDAGDLQWVASVGASDLVNQIQVDDDGHVYVVRDTVPPRLSRYDQRDDLTGLDRAWDLNLQQGDAADFLYRAGQVFIATNSEGSRSAKVQVVSDVQTDSPSLIGAYTVAFPVREITFSKAGLVYASAPDARRYDAAIDTGVDDTVVDWTPLDLVNYHQRLHGWWDAYGGGGTAANVEVDGIDRRIEYQEQSEIASGGAAYTDAIADTTQRDLTGTTYFGPDDTPYDLQPRPIYDPQALGPHPGYHFEEVDLGEPHPELALAGPSKRTWRTATPVGPETHKDKPTVNSQLPNSTGIWPRTHTQTFAITMLVRPTSTTKQVLMNLATSRWDADSDVLPYQWLCLALNGDDSGRYPGTEGGFVDNTQVVNYNARITAGSEPLGVSLYTAVKRATSAQHYGVLDTYASLPEHDRQLISKSAVSITSSNFHVPHKIAANHSASNANQRCMLITLVFEQPDPTTPDKYTRIYLRANTEEDSTAAYLFTQNQDDDIGPNAGNRIDPTNQLSQSGGGPDTGRDCIGHSGYAYDVGIMPENGLMLPDFAHFTGHIFECITYFSDSTAPQVHRNAYGSRTAGASGSFFDEVEKVEAYIAHKYGVADTVLKSNTATGTTDGSRYKTAPPASGGGGTTYTGEEGSGLRVEDQLASCMGVTGKIDLSSGEHQWAYAGPGMGYGVCADSVTGDVYTYGPQEITPQRRDNPLTGTLEDQPHAASSEVAAVHRKISDRGVFAYHRRDGFANVMLVDVPSAGDVIDVFDAASTGTASPIANQFRRLSFVTSGSNVVPPYGVNGTAIYNVTGLPSGVAGVDAMFADQDFLDALAFLFTSYKQNPPSGPAIDLGLTVTLDDLDQTASSRRFRVWRQGTNHASYDWDEWIGWVPDLDITVTTAGTIAHIFVIHDMFAGSDGVRDAAQYDLNAWAYIESPIRTRPRVDGNGITDADGNSYWPRNGAADGGTYKDNHVYKFSKSANTSEQFANKTLSDSAAIDPWGSWQYTIVQTDAALTGVQDQFVTTCVALPPAISYTYPTSDITGPQYLWVANDNVGTDADLTVYGDALTLRKISLIKRTAKNTPGRATVIAAVRGRNLYTLDKAGPSWVDRGIVVPEQTSGTDSYHTSSATVFGERYFVNNGLYTKYDPIAQTLEVVTAKRGKIPDNCRLTASYRGRWVVARNDTEPFNIFASAVGDPTDWDFSPQVPTVTQAFGGSNQETTRNPDVVNALAPFYDDVLLVGGNNSITQYRGDLSDLGQIDYFTDVTGMAFGNSWALSPEGLLYFFGSRGGVWVMSPRSDGRTQPPVEITRDTIAEELRSIDLSQHAPHLVWDVQSQGLHVYLTPLSSSPDVATEHWWYDSRTKSWWPMKFAATNLHPYCAAVLDGLTPTDRVVGIGSNDGFVRVYDSGQQTDDGVAMNSSVTIGPVPRVEFDTELRISSLQAVLGSNGTGCTYKLYAADEPVKPVAHVATGTFTVGNASRVAARARGAYIWIELSSATGSWALESLMADMHAAGRRRDR